MDFDFSPEQQQFRDQIRRLLDRPEMSLEAARSVLDGKEHYSAAAWEALAGLGVPAIMIPEEHGGIGLGALELCVAAEEIGRALTPVPFLSSAVLCAEAIRRYGSDEQRARWLPGLANGSIIGTWAASEGKGGVFSPDSGTTLASGRLTGKKMPVLDGMTAQIAVVAAHSDKDAPVLAIVELDSSGVTRTPIDTIDPSRPSVSIEFDNAMAEMLPLANAAARNDLLYQAAIILAFQQLGMADRALQMARDYALERTAFGRRIGSYQAIKHKLAEIYSRNELARAHCYYGAWALSTGAPEAPLAAAGARCAAINAATFAAQENMQVHGGISFTWEADCHLFYRRARLDALVLGPIGEWQDLLIAELRDRREAA